MTDEERVRLRDKINAEIDQLRIDIVALEKDAQAIDTDDTDEVTRMDSIVTKSMKDAAVGAAKHRLAVLEYAATRVDNEDFGYCAECGEVIPLLRLMAMPETTYCVDCAEELHQAYS